MKRVNKTHEKQIKIKTINQLTNQKNHEQIHQSTNKKTAS